MFGHHIIPGFILVMHLLVNHVIVGDCLIMIMIITYTVGLTYQLGVSLV